MQVLVVIGELKTDAFVFREWLSEGVSIARLFDGYVVAAPCRA